MYGGNFPDFFAPLKWLAIAVLLLLPLAIWKLVDIAVWISEHVTIGVN